MLQKALKTQPSGQLYYLPCLQLDGPWVSFSGLNTKSRMKKSLWLGDQQLFIQFFNFQSFLSFYQATWDGLHSIKITESTKEQLGLGKELIGSKSDQKQSWYQSLMNL